MLLAVAVAAASAVGWLAFRQQGTPGRPPDLRVGDDQIVEIQPFEFAEWRGLRNFRVRPVRGGGWAVFYLPIPTADWLFDIGVTGLKRDLVLTPEQVGTQKWTPALRLGPEPGRVTVMPGGELWLLTEREPDDRSLREEVGLPLGPDRDFPQAATKWTLGVGFHPSRRVVDVWTATSGPLDYRDTGLLERWLGPANPTLVSLHAWPSGERLSKVARLLGEPDPRWTYRRGWTADGRWYVITSPMLLEKTDERKVWVIDAEMLKTPSDGQEMQP